MAEKQKQMSYYERLGIATASIDKIKGLIKNEIKNTIGAWNKGKRVQRQAIRIIGPAGLGKTFIQQQIQKEISEELGIEFGFRLLKASMVSKDDLKLPFPKDEKDSTWNRLKFLYADMIPIKGRDPDYGIFLIDELKRGDYALQQMLWQIQDENKVDMEDIPPGWFIICTDNPDEDEYSMNEIEDAAGIRRTLDIGVEVDPKAFLNYAIEQEYHRSVIEWIQIYPNHLYDFAAQKKGSKFACPAVYERVSDQLIKYENNGGIKEHIDDLEIMLSGLLNTYMTRMFIEHLIEGKDISPEGIVFNYSKVRAEVQNYTKKGDNAALQKVFDSFLTYLSTSMPKVTMKEYKNIANFMIDVPVDTAALYLLYVEGMGKRSKEYSYMMTTQSNLITLPEFKNGFFEKMIAISRNAKVRNE